MASYQTVTVADACHALWARPESAACARRARQQPPQTPAARYVQRARWETSALGVPRAAPRAAPGRRQTRSKQPVSPACRALRPTAIGPGCATCVGNSQSAGTECVTCPAGKAANAARTACTDLLDSTQGGLTDAGVVADILSTNVVLPRVSLDIDVDAEVLTDGSAEQRAFFSTMTADIAAELDVVGVGEDDIQFTTPRGVGRRAQDAADAANLTEHASTYRRADLELQKRKIQQESNRLAECLQNLESCDLTAVVDRLQQHKSRVQELLPVMTRSPRATRAPPVVANTTRRSLQTSGSFEIVIDNDDPAAAFTALVAAVEDPTAG